MDEGLVIAPATYRDAVELAVHIRPADRDELEASGGRTPLEALANGLRASAECHTARVHGRVLAMWGVVGRATVLGGGDAVGWLLTSTLVDEYPLLFWRATKRELARLLAWWDSLTNCIDCRHVQALRWAERLGFQLEAPALFGVAEIPFRRFRVTRGDLRV